LQTSPTGIELQTKYFVLNFLIVIFPLVLTIDGVKTKGKWGKNFYPVAPGNHEVSVAYKMYWVLPLAKGTANVSVAEGQVTPLLYKVPFFWFMPGKLTPNAA
jgi:hypothetical protein